MSSAAEAGQRPVGCLFPGLGMAAARRTFSPPSWYLNSETEPER